MKILRFYKDVLNCTTEDEVFNHLIKTLKPSILQWDYFVNWEKVNDNLKKVEISLNKLNYMIGKDNFDEEFKFLVAKNIDIIEVIPILLAIRGEASNSSYKILIDYKNRKFTYKDFNFNANQVSENEIDLCIEFIKKSGLIQLFYSVKNFVDYLKGVEVGLDSNGRKNRSGKAMESITEYFIADLCNKNNFDFMKQVDINSVNKKWECQIPVNESPRKFDFVIKTNKEVIIFETNFYAGVGSKLKSTAGEYQSLNNFLKGYKFVWITDGLGWQGTKNPLKETFINNQYIFNLDMIEKGVLDEVIL